jgi:hypothetical protein
MPSYPNRLFRYTVQSGPTALPARPGAKVIDLSVQGIMWIVAGLVVLGFVAMRLQRAFYNLLLDREGAAKDLVRRR